MGREKRIERLENAIEAQKRFVRTVPDPDNRERAEANLMSLIFQRDMFAGASDQEPAGIVVA